MEKIDRELLIKEISSRLAYGVKAQVLGWDEEKGEVEVPLKVYSINTDGYLSFKYNHYSVETIYVEDCRLYLRPMYSMTDEEVKEYKAFHCVVYEHTYFYPQFCTVVNELNMFDWLNKKMFDYRGLIGKGLALEAPNEIYNN